MITKPIKRLFFWLGYSVFSVTLITFWSCNNQPAPAPTDTETTGSINISVDESLMPLIDSEASAFMHKYPDAKLLPVYKPEADVFMDLIHDSSRVVITTRTLTKDELKYFDARGFTPNVLKEAVDAIAIIINKANTDTFLTSAEIENMLEGKTANWKDINKKSSLGDIQIIFDNKNSGVVRYLIDSITHGKPFPANCYALQNTPGVIDYVSKNKNAVGFIGVNWISDKESPSVQNYLKNIRVISVEPKDSNDFYPPEQYYIAYHSYPYSRDVYVINSQARTGLGTGFASFIYNDVGQTIVQRAGLLPAHASLRFIQLKKDFN